MGTTMSRSVTVCSKTSGPKRPRTSGPKKTKRATTKRARTRWRGVREAFHPRTSGPKSARTSGPKKARTFGAKRARTSGPQKVRTSGPKKARTSGPKKGKASWKVLSSIPLSPVESRLVESVVGDLKQSISQAGEREIQMEMHVLLRFVANMLSKSLSANLCFRKVRNTQLDRLTEGLVWNTATMLGVTGNRRVLNMINDTVERSIERVMHSNHCRS